MPGKLAETDSRAERGVSSGFVMASAPEMGAALRPVTKTIYPNVKFCSAASAVRRPYANMTQFLCPLAERTDIPSPLAFIAKCDREHDILRGLYADFVVARNDVFKKSAIAKIFRILTMYVKFHFDNEYQFMSAVGHPEIKEHDAFHHGFITDIGQINRDHLDTNEAYEVIREVYYGLAREHIPEIDARLVAFARNMADTCSVSACARCKST